MPKAMVLDSSLPGTSAEALQLLSSRDFICTRHMTSGWAEAMIERHVATDSTVEFTIQTPVTLLSIPPDVRSLFRHPALMTRMEHWVRGADEIRGTFGMSCTAFPSTFIGTYRARDRAGGIDLHFEAEVRVPVVMVGARLERAWIDAFVPRMKRELAIWATHLERVGEQITGSERRTRRRDRATAA
ncbi:DUF2505 family protein [Agromyces sp. SYSU T0242]|uniref:DUF2505 family protein n=1 Tax=Agromyces litoreus TaxID=3158561 RepID=UPI003398EA1B